MGGPVFRAPLHFQAGDVRNRHCSGYGKTTHCQADRFPGSPPTLCRGIENAASVTTLNGLCGSIGSSEALAAVFLLFEFIDHCNCIVCKADFADAGFIDNDLVTA